MAETILKYLTTYWKIFYNNNKKLATSVKYQELYQKRCFSTELKKKRNDFLAKMEKIEKYP